MSETTETCEICKNSPAVTRNGFVDRQQYVTQECPACGRWMTALDTGVLSDLRRKSNAALVPYLAAYIRKQNEGGVPVVELTSENWRAFAEQHARTPISRRLDLLLRLLEKQSEYAGAYVALASGVFPFVDARNDKEVEFLAATLVEQGLLDRRRADPDMYRITGKGWEYLYPLTAAGAAGTCFVAMSFHKDLDTAYSDGILPAVEDDCKYRAYRVDRDPNNDNINDRILAGIRASQFLVADFSQHRQSVYYEAGFAQGLGRTVIRTCREADFDTLPFDTRQLVHLKWSTPADLRVTLAQHIAVTIGTWGEAR